MDLIRLSKPAPPLRGIVRFYAHREVRLREGAVVHPVPARAFPLLEFVLGGSIRVSHRDDPRVVTSPRTVLVGPQTHCFSRLQFRGVVECFVVLFQPAGLHRLFSIPMQELTDRALDARSVLGAFASRFEQMIAGCRTFSERVRMADSYLLRRALEAHRAGRISAAASQFLSASGKVRIGDVAAESGLSVRQFERGFMQQLGVSPKLFARIVRFEAALDRKARSSATSWTEIANDLGYFDQMHMIHDFKIFTGGTPTLALAEIETLFHDRLAAIQAGPRPAAADPDLDLII